MIILACDTSNSSCCAGVFDNGKPLAYNISTEKRTHAEVFMPLLHDVVIMSGKSHQDIDAYAICVGPGSFTGIRIGISSIKGMSAASDKPCIAVSSTKALAMSVENVVSDPSKTIIIPAFDARNKRVFASVLKNDTYEELVEEGAYEASSLADRIAEIYDGRKIIVVGNGAEALKEALDSRAVDAEYADGAIITPIGIDKAARDRIANEGEGVIVNAAEIKASYCAVSSAERYHNK